MSATSEKSSRPTAPLSAQFGESAISSPQEKANSGMNSILVKISLLFFATIAATLVAFWVIGYLVAPTPARRTELYSRTLAMQMGEARVAYESGGPQAVKEYLGRINKIFPNERFFADAKGRDLV